MILGHSKFYISKNIFVEPSMQSSVNISNWNLVSHLVSIIVITVHKQASKQTIKQAHTIVRR